MKRFLLLFCTVALCFVLFAVPAFAASDSGTYTIEFQDGTGSLNSSIPFGTYRVVLNVDGVIVPLEYDIIEFSAENCEHVIPIADGSGYTLQISLLEAFNDTVVDFCDSDDVQIEGSVGFVRIGDPSAPVAPDPPVKHPDSSSFLSSVGQFFSTSLSWLGSLVKVITQSPALLVLNIGIVLILFVLGLFRRMKNL